MSEVVSPTPVFIERSGGGSSHPFPLPVSAGSVATSQLTDIPVHNAIAFAALRLEIDSLKTQANGNAAAAAAATAQLRVDMAEKFAVVANSAAAVERRALESTISAMRQANTDGLLSSIASKVGAVAA